MSVPRAGGDEPQTGDYSDDGAPIWVNAQLFGAEARKALAAGVCKGDFVTVSGELKISQYETQTGDQRETLQIRYTRFNGCFPGNWYRTHPGKPQGTPESGFGAATKGSGHPGSDLDPWTAQPGF